MIAVGINHEPELDELIVRLARAGEVEAVELIVDGYERTVPELRRLIGRLGVPYSFHCVLMSIGSVDYPTHDVHLIRDAVRALRPMHFSEHLTCSRAGSVDLVQNLGVPMTPEMADVFVGVDRDHPRHRLRRAGVDRVDPRPRHRRTVEGHVE